MLNPTALYYDINSHTGKSKKITGGFLNAHLRISLIYYM